MTSRARPSPLLLSAGAILVLVVAIAADTRVVRIGAPGAAPSGVFSPASFGQAEFPKVQADVQGRAVDAATLAQAIGRDQAAAEKQYGVAAIGGAEFSVKFTGRAGNQDSGVYDVEVAGLGSSPHITVQTGPAIMGTDLRDATGKIGFGQFTNQIVYQNAGSALNAAMKQQVLAKVDAGKLTGRTISVVGVFQLSDPDTWLVTPVRLDVR